MTFVTAWLAMVTSAQVSSGETAVIIGAAGGVGSAAVQIAKSRGARVIAVVHRTMILHRAVKMERMRSSIQNPQISSLPFNPSPKIAAPVSSLIPAG